MAMIVAKRGMRPACMAVLAAVLAAGLGARSASASAVPDDPLGQANIQIDGAAPGDLAGMAVAAAGDVNGDGRTDVIVGAPDADGNGRDGSGAAYVVFAKPTLTRVDLAALGGDGFRVDGAAAGDRAGTAVSGAGDVNGDGRADVVVGAPGADANGRPDSGSVHVVFGRSSPDAVDLATLVSAGFRIDGQATGDHAGTAVAMVGDLNRDGRDDLMMGAPLSDNRDRVDSGSAYVIYGRSSPDAVDLASPLVVTIRIDGAAAGDHAGAAVAAVGDASGDGLRDLGVGAPGADNNGRPNAGSAYILFGGGLSAAVDLAALRTAGERIDGATPSEAAGSSLAAAGDVDGDGRDDLMVGAPQADNQSRPDSGSAYIVFGGASPATVDLGEPGWRGQRIDGANAGDRAGFSVAWLGDRNGDGRADPVTGAPFADAGGREDSGAAHLTYGCPRLEYGRDLVVAEVGQPLGPIRPQVSGGGEDETFTVAPQLPDGLELDRQEGTISGTPAEAGDQTNHAIRMTGSRGCVATVTLRIVVKDLERIDLPMEAQATLEGTAAYLGDMAGHSVAGAGDVNGDGRPDVIVGAPFALGSGHPWAGSAYVVFGESLGGSVRLNDLGGRGFRIEGPTIYSQAGTSVAGAGDMNGDGLDDVIVGAPDPSRHDVLRPGAGSAYVVFGKASTGAVQLDELGDQGFQIIGAAGDPDGSGPLEGDQVGWSVSGAGDVNGDDLNDVIVGATQGSESDPGSAYVVFGKRADDPTLTDPIDLATIDGQAGDPGFRILGTVQRYFDPGSVAGAGDVDGDGLDDVIVGSQDEQVDGRARAGAAYVVYGKSGGDAVEVAAFGGVPGEHSPVEPVDLRALGERGFRIGGASPYELAGAAVAGAGDVNGDELGDLVVGAPTNWVDKDPPRGRGAAYVVFGRPRPSADDVDLANLGDGGFRIVGATVGDLTGYAVASAGDVDGNDRDDVLVGAPSAEGQGRYDAGAAYVVYGKPTGDAVDLAALGQQGEGLPLEGGPLDAAGTSVAGAGDVDGDDLADILVGAPSTGVDIVSGVAYMVLGRAIAPEGAAAGGAAAQGSDYDELLARARRDGKVRVIVSLKTSFAPEGRLTGRTAIDRQRTGIARVQRDVLSELAPEARAQVKRFKFVPALALQVDAADLKTLASLPQVESVTEDGRARPALAQSVPLIGADDAWAAGASGEGQTVAVLDTGVDAGHPFLRDKVVSEACYSTTDDTDYPDYYIRSLCPAGSGAYAGAGVPCVYALLHCDHGTHVAGIATGNGQQAGVGFSGVAKDAKLISIQVFSWVYDSGEDPETFLSAYFSNVMTALERVYELRTTYSIAAVNMSLAGYRFTDPCDDSYRPVKAAIDNLRAAGIGTVVAAGNDGDPSAISAPACISSAVSVGSTTKSDEVSSFSNSAYFLDLLAPGGCGWRLQEIGCPQEEDITSSVPGGGYEVKAGTSMAAPHVAGAWAAIKSRWPGASVDEVRSLLEETGAPVMDARMDGPFAVGDGRVRPRIQLDAAIQRLDRRIVDLHAGSDGEIGGATAGERAGYSLANAGDLDGDGLADLIVGAPNAGNCGRPASGSVYLVYGTAAPSPSDSGCDGAPPSPEPPSPPPPDPESPPESPPATTTVPPAKPTPDGIASLRGAKARIRKRVLVMTFQSSAAAKVKLTVTQRFHASQRGKRRVIARVLMRRTLKAGEGANRFVLPLRRLRAGARLTATIVTVGDKRLVRVPVLT